MSLDSLDDEDGKSQTIDLGSVAGASPWPIQLFSPEALEDLVKAVGRVKDAEIMEYLILSDFPITLKPMENEWRPSVIETIEEALLLRKTTVGVAEFILKTLSLQIEGWAQMPAEIILIVVGYVLGDDGRKEKKCINQAMRVIATWKSAAEAKLQEVKAAAAALQALREEAKVARAEAMRAATLSPPVPQHEASTAAVQGGDALEAMDVDEPEGEGAEAATSMETDE